MEVDMKVNLLEETELTLSNHGKTLAEINWLGARSVMLDLDGKGIEGIRNALNIDYDDGYGRNEICLEFMVCGSNWWLERHEYDGSEWWEYKEQPTMPKVKTSNHKDVLED